MERAKLLVMIPVGPTCHPDYVRDTVESILHFTTPSRRIIILDDSGKESGKALRNIFPDIIVLKTPRSCGKNAGLYLNLSLGFEFAHKRFDYSVILRLDTDALVIGNAPEEDAIHYFRQNPEAGIIGSYRIDCNGEPRDFSGPRERLKKEIDLYSLYSEPRRLRGVMFLRKMVRKGMLRGYELGEHCLGGAYFISRECVSRLYQNKLLSRREIQWSKLQEDHIFGLLIHTLGLRHGDFATGNLPMGLRWRGLPCAPDELLARGKKVTHSTRFYNGMTEEQIREFFGNQRKKARFG